MNLPPGLQLSLEEFSPTLPEVFLTKEEVHLLASHCPALTSLHYFTNTSEVEDPAFSLIAKFTKLSHLRMSGGEPWRKAFLKGSLR